MERYDAIQGAPVPIKPRIRGVSLADAARQLLTLAKLIFVFRQVAAKADVPWGMGATAGSIIANRLGSCLIERSRTTCDAGSSICRRARRPSMTVQRVLAFVSDQEAVPCHRNYVSWERHFSQSVTVTRKGAASAQANLMEVADRLKQAVCVRG